MISFSGSGGSTQRPLQAEAAQRGRRLRVRESGPHRGSAGQETAGSGGQEEGRGGEEEAAGGGGEEKRGQSEKISPRMSKNFRELPSNVMEARALEEKVIVFPVPSRDVANQTLPAEMSLTKLSLAGNY